MTQDDQVRPALQWDLFIRQRASATQGVPPGKEALTWVANTVTLLYGERDAVLVDTFMSDAHTRELIEWIEAHDRRLVAIYVTHGHPDHFFGLKRLIDRFPGVRAFAPPAVVAAMQRTLAAEAAGGGWRARFPGQLPDELVAAEVMQGDTFELEGHELRVIDTGHTDTDDTTALYVPSIGLLIAGDAIYNGTHPYLVESGREGLAAWLAAIDRIAALEPRAVVVGHGPLEPDCSPRHIDETRQYLLDFERLDRETQTARELYDRMLERYPDRINPGSLWGSAHAAKKFSG